MLTFCLHKNNNFCEAGKIVSKNLFVRPHCAIACCYALGFCQVEQKGRTICNCPTDFKPCFFNN